MAVFQTATDDGYRSATPIAGDESPKFLQRRFFRTPKAEVRNGKQSTWIRKRCAVSEDLAAPDRQMSATVSQTSGCCGLLLLQMCG
jgi:hypothetical protein